MFGDTCSNIKGKYMINKYGEKVKYKLGEKIKFSDFDLEYLGVRKIPGPGKLVFTYYDFKISKDNKYKNISWSSGTGDIAPNPFKFNGLKYSILKNGTLDLPDGRVERLKEDELIVFKEESLVDTNKNLPLNSHAMQFYIMESKSVTPAVNKSTGVKIIPVKLIEDTLYKNNDDIRNDKITGTLILRAPDSKEFDFELNKEVDTDYGKITLIDAFTISAMSRPYKTFYPHLSTYHFVFKIQ